jgi:hypothetical protein
MWTDLGNYNYWNFFRKSKKVQVFLHSDLAYGSLYVMSHPECPFSPAVVSVVPPNVAKPRRSAQTGVLPCLAEKEGGDDGTVRTACPGRGCLAASFWRFQLLI